MANLSIVPNVIALRLQRICDTDEKYHRRSSEYQKYLKGRE